MWNAHHINNNSFWSVKDQQFNLKLKGPNEEYSKQSKRFGKCLNFCEHPLLYLILTEVLLQIVTALNFLKSLTV